LLTEPRLVALPADDPLAAHPELELADLAGRVLPDGTAADAGGTISAPGRVLDLAQIFNLVEVGGVVWFAPRSVALRHPRPGIAYRPVRGLQPTTLVVAWPQQVRSAAVAAFVRVAVRCGSDRTGHQLPEAPEPSEEPPPKPAPELEPLSDGGW